VLSLVVALLLVALAMFALWAPDAPSVDSPPVAPSADGPVT